MSNNNLGGYSRSPGGTYRLGQYRPFKELQTRESSLSDDSEGTIRGDSSDSPIREFGRLTTEPEIPVQTPPSPPGLLQEKPDQRKRRHESIDNEVSLSREKKHQKTVDLTEDEVVDLVAEEEREAAIQQDLEEEKLAELVAKLPRHPPRNLPVFHPFEEKQRFEWEGKTLIPGKTLELHSGDFLRIKAIITNAYLQGSAAVKLRGWLLKRFEQLGEPVEYHRNELYYFFDVDKDDNRPVLEQAISEVGLKDIKKIRKVVYTNQKYPAFSNIAELRARRKKEGLPLSFIYQNEVLVVRSKIITLFANAQYRAELSTSHSWTKHHIRRTVEFLRQDECSPGNSSSDRQLRDDYRQWPTELGGSYIIEAPHESARRTNTNPNVPLEHSREASFVDLDREDFRPIASSPRGSDVRHRLGAAVIKRVEDQRQENEEKWIAAKEGEALRANIGSSESRHKNRRAAKIPSLATPIGKVTRRALHYYTYGDAFCGAGGMTRGAYMAGLKIMWGLDADVHAAKTWEENFPFADLYQMWADEFLRLPDEDRNLIVDIIHLSPPCQFFSPAHTRQGPNDDHNNSSMFVVDHILDKARPRIATLEETFGLLQRHKDYFHALLRMFTSKGFSVSWQIVDMQAHGVPQTRRRLIITASCPGEALPDFVAPTYSENGRGGLKPFVDPKSVLRNIPRDAANHEIKVPKGQPLAWAANKPVATITTSGQVPYPDGSRMCTQREIAALQTFPHDHVFRAVKKWPNADQGLEARGMKKSKGDEIRRQIGNSVPPVFGEALLKHITQHLRIVDRRAS